MRNPTPLRAIALIGVACLAALSACGGGDEAPATEVSAKDLSGAWRLDGDRSTPRVDSGATVTIAFDSGQVSGQGPCNRYLGTFALEGSTLSFGELASTQMACPDDVTQAEQAYFAALDKVDTVERLTDSELVLTGEGTTLAYTRKDATAEVVGRWNVTSINTGDALVSPVEGTTVTVTFAEDGTLSAEAGCNTIASHWALDGSQLIVDPPEATGMLCPDPAVMAQEAAVVAALDSSVGLEVADLLTLYNGSGQMTIVASREG